MQQVVEYFSANMGRYPVELLVHNLRQAGHDELTIAHGWDAATSRQPHLQQGPRPAAMPATRELVLEYQPPTPRAPFLALVLLGLVVCAVAVVLGIGILESSPDRPLEEERLRSEIAQSTDLSAPEVDEILDSVGGATVDGRLPEGWARQRDGMWIDQETGNNVIVMVGPAGGLSLDEIVALNLREFRREGQTRVDEPKPGRLFGEPSLVLLGTSPGEGFSYRMRQSYVLVGGSLVIVTETTATAPDAREQRHEVDTVVDNLRLVEGAAT